MTHDLSEIIRLVAYEGSPRAASRFIIPGLLAFATATAEEAKPLPTLPHGATLVFQEDWSSGKIEPKRWYVPRKKWGQGDHGVSPENVRIGRDLVDGKDKPVLICQATGDLYDGPVTGFEGRKTRVGGIVVTRDFFASGRYQVVMKIGEPTKVERGPDDPTRPKGAVPAVWTYG